MRQSYTVTIPEDPPATAFTFLKQDMRRKGSAVSGSVLVSTFVGLLINQAKVRTHLGLYYGHIRWAVGSIIEENVSALDRMCFTLRLKYCTRVWKNTC